MPTEAALAIVNARVWTNDPRRPWVDAILVRGQRIEAVGSSAEVRKMLGRENETVDAKGMMIVPGVIEPGATGMNVVYGAINRREGTDAQTTTTIGRLQVGTIADLTMIDRDLTRIAPEMAGDARIVLAMRGGAILRDAASASRSDHDHV